MVGVALHHAGKPVERSGNLKVGRGRLGAGITQAVGCQAVQAAAQIGQAQRRVELAPVVEKIEPFSGTGILEFAAVVDPVSAYRPPLRDTLHELLPNLQAWRAAPEVGHLVSVLHLAAQMLWHFDQRALDAIRTFLWVHGPLVVMRGLCFSSTLLPNTPLP
jgi:hypothetical protein